MQEKGIEIERCNPCMRKDPPVGESTAAASRNGHYVTGSKCKREHGQLFGDANGTAAVGRLAPFGHYDYEAEKE
jgi:hypothetical protein